MTIHVHIRISPPPCDGCDFFCVDCGLPIDTPSTNWPGLYGRVVEVVWEAGNPIVVIAPIRCGPCTELRDLADSDHDVPNVPYDQEADQ